MKKILITGGNGYIGRNLVEQLSDEYEIRAPQRSELDLTNSNAVENFLKKSKFDVVVHTATVGGNRKNPGPPNMAEINLKMFFNIVRCRKYFKKMIQCGSGAEYDKLHYIPRMKEDYFDTYVPSDDYGFYKYICSKHIEKDDKIICLRIFGCYGKYEDYEIKFISNAICKTLFDLPITIHNKNVFFSYLYIDDFVKIVEHFIKNNGKHKFYNVVPNETIDLLSIARKINHLSGSKHEIIIRNSGLNPEYSGDNSRLTEEMPGFKFTDIDSGIKKLHIWYSQNKSSIDKEKLLVDM